ncbi:MAG TPA: 50S ribosomal protein L16 [archaeon]|nr:50S ribosomal protein L16 [archaeon]
MGIRPGKCYRTMKRPYTRQSQRKPKKGYIKGVPGSKLVTFEMGKPKDNFTLKVSLVAERSVQIRHNSLEAARVAANKFLADALGEENFYMKVIVFPHHVLRENAMATGAGADRYQSGMRLAFGRPVGTAARVFENQKIFSVMSVPGKYSEIKKAFKVATSKLPTPCKVVVEK